MYNLVMSAGVGHGDFPGLDRVDRSHVDVWLDELSEAVRSIRDLQRQLKALVEPAEERGCDECGTSMLGGRADRRFCSPACRQRAYRKRNG
jgi:hypothetical protein